VSRFIPFFTPILHEITAILLQDYFTLKIDFLIILNDYLKLSNSSGIIFTAVKPYFITGRKRGIYAFSPYPDFLNI
jgi:hypothetical protein